MRMQDIKVGRVYCRDVGDYPTRLVLGIGQAFRPGSHVCDGVLFEQVYPSGRTEVKKLYLDTFARWARKEVKP